jgi:hypothetical protein
VTSPVIRLDRVRANLQRRQIRDLVDASSVAVDALDPYWCIGPLHAHQVTRENPLRTGRCLSCHQFVGETQKGWRAVSTTQARLFNLYGARRTR